MSHTIIPKGYQSCLTAYQTQTAIGELRRTFEDKLSAALNLKRVSAPLFVDPHTGLNDDLNGVERPVRFSLLETGTEAEVVHSLAKWKRMALKKYGFSQGEGLYTNMNAIRRDEQLDNLHSVYVDQWDWERVIGEEERNIETLKWTVGRIVDAICDTHEEIRVQYPALKRSFCREVAFLSAQELELQYPDLTPKQRENAAAQEYGTVFLMGIGAKLASGQRHDGRAPDYDDWTLNGDILFWDEVLQCALEVSSMGIRVDAPTLRWQLKEAGCEQRAELPFHASLLKGELPQTIGGGIGQSRLCMLLLEKAHIGEVQVSVWDEQTQKACQAAGIELL